MDSKCVYAFYAVCSVYAVYGTLFQGTVLSMDTVYSV